MLVIAVMLKLGRVVSPSLQLGAFHVYKFISTAVTYPLLFAIGVSLTPWDKRMIYWPSPLRRPALRSLQRLRARGDNRGAPAG
jgi:malate:Na+ symporter